MRSRLLAAAILAASGLLAWLAITFTPAARLLQAAVALSLLYVGFLAWKGWRVMRTLLAGPMSPPPDAPRPWVTVIVPAANEAGVVADCVSDLARQEYGDASGPRYDVLVVDDASTDETAEVARAAAAQHERIRIVRRTADGAPRTKAAVLAFAQPLAVGEVTAVIDADARMEPGWLASVVGAWQADADAAAIQSQRRVLSAAGGWLPAAQDEEQLMDMASQCGRWATDGTAELRGNGMLIRRSALERVGGWNPASLTEDLDLSTRLVAAGEHVTLAPQAQLGEEAVAAVGPLWRQRMRWAEGSLRRLMDHGPGLVADRRIPRGRRLDFVLFVGEFVIPPLFVASIAASLASVVLPGAADWTVPASLFVGYGLGTFLLAMAGLAAHGHRGAPLLGRAARGSLFLSHWLLVVPAALVRIALFTPTVDFVRTPRDPRARP